VDVLLDKVHSLNNDCESLQSSVEKKERLIGDLQFEIQRSKSIKRDLSDAQTDSFRDRLKAFQARIAVNESMQGNMYRRGLLRGRGGQTGEQKEGSGDKDEGLSAEEQCLADEMEEYEAKLMQTTDESDLLNSRLDQLQATMAALDAELEDVKEDRDCERDRVRVEREARESSEREWLEREAQWLQRDADNQKKLQELTELLAEREAHIAELMARRQSVAEVPPPPEDAPEGSPEAGPADPTTVVHEEVVLVSKGVMSKLGLDASGNPYSKKHFFALYTTNLQYDNFYPLVDSASELRWGRTECDFHEYSHGTTVRQAYHSAAALAFLRLQPGTGAQLADMVRAEDLPRLVVLSTVDSRFVMLMTREMEMDEAGRGISAMAWVAAVYKAVETNRRLAAGLSLDDLDETVAELVARAGEADKVPGVDAADALSVAQQRAALCANFGTAKTAVTTQTGGAAPEDAESNIQPGAPTVQTFGSRPSGPTSHRGSFINNLPEVKIFEKPIRAELTKFTHNGRSYHKKQFHLSPGGVIQWGDSPSKYKYQEIVKSVIRGYDSSLKIDTKNCQVNADHIFTVKTSGKQLYLVAPDAETLDEWVDAIEACVQLSLSK
jgi:hypothetical protein